MKGLCKYCFNCPHLSMRFLKYSTRGRKPKGYYKGGVFMQCSTHRWLDGPITGLKVSEEDFENRKHEYFGSEYFDFDSKDIPASFEQDFMKQAKKKNCVMENNAECVYYAERSMEEWNRKRKI